MSLFGHDPYFFDVWEKQSRAALEAAREFHKLSQDFSHAREAAQTLKRIEAQADQLTHELVSAANDKFITPFDKEDLHRLTLALDDLTDHLEAVTARIVIYRLDKPRPDLAQLADLTHQTIQATHDSVHGLRNLKEHEQLQKNLIRVHELEGKSDEVYRQALDTLFSDPSPDPLYVMKWKEIYDRLEVTVDQCENVADTLESMMVKYV